jgi:hypothetical protein
MIQKLSKKQVKALKEYKNGNMKKEDKKAS